MSITAYTGFRPEMVARLPDCPLFLIDQALQMGGREFCVESEAYRTFLTAINLVADQSTYTITAPTYYEILRITEVQVKTAAQVTASEDGTVQDPMDYEFNRETGVLKFYSAPSSESVTSGLSIQVALAPMEDTDTLDSVFRRRWGTYIVAWAYQHLFSMNEKTWASPDQTTKYYDLFRRGVAYARRERDTLNTTHGTSMGFRGFLDR